MSLSKSANNMKKFLSAFAQAAFAVACLVSCKVGVGLGETIDTESPTLAITYPAATSVIRDSFILSGTWNDDKAVTSINVSVKKAGTNETVVSELPATINKDNTWQIELNDYNSANSDYYNGWQFADGTYVATVFAKDDAGHEVSQPLTFDIDNTPPVLVLTKPTTAGSATAKSYGRQVQLEGIFSEKCSSGISELVVRFYNASGEYLFDYSSSNILDMSNANPLIVAEYYDSGNEPEPSSENYAKWQNYQKLYGEEAISAYRENGSALSAQFYFTVTASDAAKLYKGASGSGNSDGGNVSKTYYRGTTEMLNLINSKTDGFPEFTVATLSSYLNGTDSTYSGNEKLKSILDSSTSVSASDENVGGISQSLSNTSVSDGNVYLTFTMNPANNPAYTISGLSIDTTAAADSENYTDGYYNYYADSTINASVAVGLDETNLDTSTVSIYYTREGDDSKNLFWTWNYDVALEYAVAGGLDEATAAANISTSPKTYRYTATTKGENSDSLSITSSLSANEITPGYKYVFSIEGKDINGQSIVASSQSGFGFMAKANTSIPRISFGNGSGYLNPATQSAFSEKIFNGKNLKFSGTVSSSDAVVSKNYKITVSDSADSAKSSTATVSFDNSSDSFDPEGNAQYVYSWSFTVVPTDEMKTLVSSGSGLYVVDVVVSAMNGGGEAMSSRTYYLDTTAPALSNITVSGGYTDSAGTVYINNTRTFTLSGTSTDNYLIGETSYIFEGVGSDGKSLKVSSESSNTNISWSFEDISLGNFVSQEEKPDIVLTVTAQDKSGNSTEKTFSIEIDTTAPAGKHVYDKNSKDLIFRIGEGDNQLADLKAYDSTITAPDDKLDKDVGGKYKYDDWGNTQTITIRGDWAEEGSGVAMVYYKIYSDEPDDEKITSFLENYDTLKDGYFVPSIEDDDKTKRVSYTDENGNNAFTEISSSFKTTISGLNAGSNYLVLAAVDNVGNAGVDTLEAVCVYDNSSESIDETELGWNSKIAAVSLNVDIEAPTFSSSSSGTVYTNKISPISVSGTAADNASGISSVVLTVDGNPVKAETGTEAGDIKTSTHWTAQIASGVLSALSGTSYNVSVTVTDNAGNQTSNTVFTLQVDTTPPFAQISSPGINGTALNGKISVSGTVDYESALPERFELYYTLTQPDSSTALENLTQISSAITDSAKIYSWSFSEVDVTSLSKADESNPVRTIYLVPVVYDTAGNCNIYTETVETGSAPAKTYSYTSGENYFVYTVDQNTDRPVVKISNLAEENSAYILKYGTNAQVTGTVTDDDSTASAVIDSLVISEEAYTGSESITGTTTFNASTGDFTFTPKDTSDGEKTFYIYIKDNAGGVFYTTASTGTASASGEKTYLHNPVLYLKTEPLDDSVASVRFAYKSDSSSPAVENAQSYTCNASSLLNTVIDSSGNEVALLETVDSSFIAGGLNKSKLQFVISASDANGIVGMTAELLYGTSSVGKYATSSSYAGFGQSVAQDGFAATTDSTVSVWTTDFIDISDISVYSSGTYTLRVTAYDTSGLYGNGTYSFLIDNAAPAIKITSPSSSAEVTGDTAVTGTALDEGGSATEDVYWFVPTTTQINAVTAGIEQSYWRSEILSAIASSSPRAGNTLDSGSTVNVWSFIFGATGSSPKLTSFDDADFMDPANTSLYNIPLYIMAQDELGNYSVETGYIVKHNPDGDKPVTAVTYPDAPETTLGGTIRLSGTVVIPSNTTAASAVFMQIDKSTALESSYVEDLADSNGNKIYKVYTAAEAIKEVTGEDVQSSSYAAYGFASETAFSSWWGIKANKSASSSMWSKNINSNGEFDPEEKGTTNTICLRACGINANGKVGAWTQTYTVKVDNSAPTITPGINQFSSISQVSSSLSSASVSTVSLASKAYSANMYLKGQWYIAATVLDETGVSSIAVTENGNTKSSYNIITTSNSISSLTLPSGYYIETVSATENSVQKKGFRIYIPVSQTNTNDGAVLYTLTVVDSDSTNHTASMEFALNIDNTPPSIDMVTGNGDTLAQNGKVSYTASSRYNIQEKNYVFTPGGKVSDTGSGFERVLFQFVRSEDDVLTGGSEVVIDPMIVHTSGSSYEAAKAEIDGNKVKAQSIAQGAENYSLYGRNVSGSLSSRSTFTASADISDDKHIRNYGIIYVDGLYRIITGISGSEVAFEPEVTSYDSTATITAFFPYAQVVDNTSTEKISSYAYSDNPLKLSGDDGDGMLESISKAGKTWAWDATIHSTNMPDGPATLIVIAFDAAGNVSGSQIPVMVANNAPRLAKLWLGTDLNSSGTFEANEFETYNLLSGNADKGLEAVEKDLENKFTAKNKLALVTEFTGGNGDIEMAYLRGSKSLEAVKAGDASGFVKADSSSVASSNSASLTSAASKQISSLSLDSYFSSSTVNAYILSNENLTGFSTDDEKNDGTEKNFSFTFWDSTDETSCGTSSQNARLVLSNMALDLVDKVSPTVVVNPLYWAGASKNSLYGNSKNNGHIELESDLDTANTFKNASGEYDADPKVSGKIVFTGTAYDEHLLSSVSFKVSSSDGANVYMSGTAAEYADSAWKTGTDSISSEGWEAEVIYESGEAKSAGNYYDDTVYFNQLGHKAYWTLAIDTEKLKNVAAAADLVLTVTAKDKAGNENAADVVKPATAGGYVVADGATNVPSYQIDVVPYITRLSTSLDGAYSANASVFNRSALGKYPVRAGETLSLYGFNLNGDSTTVTVGESTSEVTAGDGCITFTAPEKSGKLSVKVNDVESLNNLNSNPGFENYEAVTCTYNAEGNGINNKLLDDDRELYVWSFNTRAEDSQVNYPTMRVGKDKNQTVAFVYGSGGQYVKYYMDNGIIGYTNGVGNGVADKFDRSFSPWNSTAVAVDTNGYIYGSAQNSDSGGAKSMDGTIDTTGLGTTYANYKYYAFIYGTNWTYKDNQLGGFFYKDDEGVINGNKTYNSNNVCLEWDYANNNFYPERVLNPKIAIRPNPKDSEPYTDESGAKENRTVGMYTVYYDSAYNRVVFRYGEAYYYGFNSIFDSQYGIKGREPKTESAEGYQVIAGTDASDNNTGRAGEYSAVGVIPSTVKSGNGTAGTAVVAWYDASSQSLLLSYNENPISQANASAWGTNTKVIDSDFAGWYMDMAVDPDGGIHLAYYGAANGDLRYAYLPSYTSDAQVCIVDSFLSVGSNISIDYKEGSVTKADGTEETRYVPYISYYMGALSKTKNSVRVAWLSKLGDNDVIADGAVNDIFTGSWEAMTVPEEQIPLDYTIGVGIKKNTSDTDSPILGYGTKNGLRTAALE